MTKRYASRTQVPVIQSQGEIKDLLRSLGVDRIGMADSPTGAFVFFETNTAAYTIRLPVHEGRMTVAQRKQRERSDWRSVALLVKARVVAIRQGITTLEQEFMAETTMPDGSRLIDHYDDVRRGIEERGGPLQLVHMGAAV